MVLFSILVKVLFLFSSGVYQKPRFFEDEEVASNLLEGKGFYYLRYHGTKYYGAVAPGFPILCYVVYKLFGHNPLYIIFIQILITSLIVILASLITRRLFNEKTAIFACFLIAFFPPLIVYSTYNLHPMNVYSFLFVLLILMFMRLRESLIFKNICFTGIIIGLSLLFRSTSLVITLLGIIWFFIVAHYETKQKFWAIASIILIAFILILPWSIRNYLVYGKVQVLQTADGESLWWGNAPSSLGSLYAADGNLLYEKLVNQLPSTFFNLSELEQSKYLGKSAISHIRRDPINFIKQTSRKMFYFWYFSPYQGSLYPKLWMFLYKIYYLIIFFLALFSIIYNLTSGKVIDKANILFILFIFLAISGVHSLYFVEGRHRWSIESLVLIFTANGFVVLWDYFARKKLNRRSF